MREHKGRQDLYIEAKPDVLTQLLIKAYDEFEQRVAHLAYRRQPKSERVRELVKRQLGKFTKRTILDAAPDISEAAVELELSKMLAEGLIRKIGAGRGTGYVLFDHYSA